YLRISWEAFHAGCLEAYDKVALLKGGRATADTEITVSPTYALEVGIGKGILNADPSFRDRPNLFRVTEKGRQAGCREEQKNGPDPRRFSSFPSRSRCDTRLVFHGFQPLDPC
ncbi:MAG: glycogen/starch synthase, partial [Thermodesulfobacteriota bacterium]